MLVEELESGCVSPLLLVSVGCVGEWGPCNVSCERTFTIVTVPAGQASECAFADGTEDSRDCIAGMEDCPGIYAAAV